MLLPCLLAALAFGTSSSAATFSDPGQVVVHSYADKAFYTEAMDGTITSTLPDPGGLTPVAFSAAADGSIAFTNGESVGPLWLLRTNGQTKELDSNANDTDPSIAPDGSKVTFVRFDPQTGASDIYVVGSDGLGLTLVASGGGTNTFRQPHFSPDGGSIAYACVPAPHPASSGKGCGPLPDGTYRRSGLLLMKADGTDKRLIVIGPEFLLDTPPSSLSWSSGGKWLTADACVPEKVGQSQTCIQQVFAYRTDGSDLFNEFDAGRQVTHETTQDNPGYEQFCGSSNQILFEISGGYYVIGRDGTNEHQVGVRFGQGSCVPPASGAGPPKTVDATHVKVPNVHGLSGAAAKSRLKLSFLGARVSIREFSPNIPRGHVVSQSPRAGATVHRSVERGPTVKLVLSRGPRR